MDSESIYYPPSIDNLFIKNLYTFKEKQYEPFKKQIIETIEITIEIDTIIDTIIDNIDKL